MSNQSHDKIYLVHKVRSDGIVYFYQRLRDLREDRDLTQQKVAEILKVAREQYLRYEKGKQELPMHHFITLARYYNVSLDFLAGLIDTPEKLERFEKK